MNKKHELLKALARCGAVETGKTEEVLGVSEAIAVALLSEKLIGQEEKNNRSFYLLTTKGEQYIKKEIPEIKQIYRGFIVEQDLVLMEFYGKLDQQTKDTWITKDDFIVRHQLPGTVDGAYVNEDGEVVGVKALSNKASFSAVEKVENFLKQAEIPHIYYLHYNPSSN